MSTAALESTVTRIRIMSTPQVTETAGTPVAPIKTQCSSCHLRDLCLPCGMSGNDIDRLDSMKFTRRKVKAGQTLYREGDRFQYIYAVRTGTLKSSLMLSDGREQVSGFHIAGELVGLDGVAQGQHASATMALEDTEICAIPYAHLSDLADGHQRHAARHQPPDEPRDPARAQPDDAAGQHERRGATGRLPAEPVAALRGARLFGARVPPAHEPRRDRQLPGHEAGNRQPHLLRLPAAAPAGSGQASHP